MRIRAVIAIVLLLLPAVADAQRIRLPGRGRGPRPAPLPPQAPGIARELSYVRLPYSVESYPFVSYFVAPGLAPDGVRSTWTSGGMGTRLDYRITPLVSATLDMTSSFFGGPALTQTVELGTRVHPQRFERRVYPFVDVRFGYMHAYDSFTMPADAVGGFPPAAPFRPGTRYSHGVGGVGGAGIEYALSRRFSLMTAAAVMRTHMSAYGFEGARPVRDNYSLTSFRLTLGVRYNPVRLIAAAVE